MKACLLLVKEAAQESSARSWENELIEEKTIVSETKKDGSGMGKSQGMIGERKKAKKGWGIKVS